MWILDKLRTLFSSSKGMYLLVRPTTSEVMISEDLFKSILADHPNDSKSINVLFTTISRHYCMFFNPIWEKHSVIDPSTIQTVPVTIGKNGHIGFQSVQPTVIGIMTFYNIGKDLDKDKWYRINITKNVWNDEPFYILDR